MQSEPIPDRLRGRIVDLIVEAEAWRAFHKARGQAGYIEALTASIRIKALQDVLDVAKEADQP
jgi:SH3-like domain-containing protein